MTISVQEMIEINNVVENCIGNPLYLRYIGDQVRVRVENEKYILNVKDNPCIKDCLMSTDIPRLINMNGDSILVLSKLKVCKNYIVYIDYTVLRRLDIEKIKIINYVMSNVLSIIKENNFEDITFGAADEYIIMIYGEIAKEYTSRGIEPTLTMCYKWEELAEKIKNLSISNKGKTLILKNLEEFNNSLGFDEIFQLDDVNTYIIVTKKIYNLEKLPKFLTGSFKGVDYKFVVKSTRGHYGEYGGHRKGLRNVFIAQLL